MTSYYVVNLDMSQQPDSHWIAIKISKSKCKNEYFDSYGLGPPTVCFKKFMRYNYTYNSKRLQHSLSTTCAQWCIYVVRRRGRLTPRQPLSVCALLPALREEQASTASWEPRPPFEAAEMD